MRGRYLLEAPAELLDAGKAEAKRRKIPFAVLLRTALGKEIGTERLAEPGTNGKGTAEEAPDTAKTSVAPGSVSPLVPSLPAPKVERCGFRNPLYPVTGKCSLAKGHEGRHDFA